MPKQNLIFIPGWNMRAEIFKPFVYDLEGKFICHFLTPHFADYDSNVCQIISYINENKLQEISLLGWSMGGQLAILVAAKIKIDRLFLLDSAAIFSRNIAEQESFYKLCQSYFMRAIKYFHKLMGNLSIADTVLLKSNFIDDQVQALGLLKELHKRDLSDNFKKLSCSIVIIHSREDKIIPFAEAEYLKSLSPQARLLELAGDFHFPFLNHRDKIARAILMTGEQKI